MKRCTCCGLTHSHEQWNALPLRGYVGTYVSGGTMLSVELRDCSGCKSTLGVEVETPEAVRKKHAEVAP